MAKYKFTKRHPMFLTLAVMLATPLVESKPNGAISCPLNVPYTKGLSESLSLAKMESPVTQAIMSRYPNSTFERKNTEDCKCETKPIQPTEEFLQTLSQISNIFQAHATSDDNNKNTEILNPLFKTECLKTMNQFHDRSDLLQCTPSPNQKDKFSNTRAKIIKQEPISKCLSDDVINYQNAVLSDAYRCVSETLDFPLSPETILKKLSQESTFKPNIKTGSGAGIGQITSIYIDDLETRGRNYLNEIQKSKEPACNFAKTFLQKDLSKNQFPSTSNRCDYTQYGEGFERNVLFSLVGHVTNWNKFVKAKITPYLDKIKKSNSSENDPESEAKIKEILTLVAYGANGYNNVSALTSFIKDRGFKSTKDIAKFLETKQPGSRSLNIYYTQLSNRENDMKNYFNPQNQTVKENFEKEGYKACVNH